MPDLSVPSLTETCRFLSDPALDGRYPGSEGHETARQYLEEMLVGLKFDPLFRDSWSQPVMDGSEIIGQNLGGIKRGKSGRSILLGAHYDHFQGIPGADDNAAALSILIETCRLIGSWDGEHDLVLCFFDLEEPLRFHTIGMGSMWFVDHAPIDLDGLDCAVILDLCGHDVAISGHDDALFVLGAEHSDDLVQAVRSVNDSPVPTYMFRNDRVGDMSDHHAFRLAAKPFLFLSCGRWEHYHQSTDTFEKLNLTKMQGIAEFIVKLVQELDGRSVRLTREHDFEDVERESVRRLAGVDLPGVPLDMIIGELMKRFRL